MEIATPDAFLVRAGFVLFTLVLMALGLAWGLLSVSPLQVSLALAMLAGAVLVVHALRSKPAVR